MRKADRAASIGLELSVDAVRAVAISGGREPKLLAQTEAAVKNPEDLGLAALGALEELGCRGPIRILQLGANARYFNVELPRMSSAERRRALGHRIDEELDDNAHQYLVGQRVRKAANGGQSVAVIAIPREPVESVAAMLEEAGHQVTGVVAPTTLVGSELGPSEEGCLWVDIGGTRTIVTLTQRDRVVLSREIPPRQEYADDDEMAQFERQMAEFQEVERSVLYFRQNIDNKGPNRVVLQAAEAELKSFLGQFKEPLTALDVQVEDRPAWSGIEFEALDPMVRRRLALAVRTAKATNALAAIPEARAGGARNEAADELERSISREQQRAEAQLGLAQALHAGDGARDEIIALARRARAYYEANEDHEDYEDALRRVDALLAERGEN